MLNIQRISWRQVAFTILGLGLILICFVQLWRANSGLEIVQIDMNGVPTTILHPQEIDIKSRPIVLLGHGFSGSGTMMSGYGLTLANAGYVVATWDFAGHGANPNSMKSDMLIHDPENVLAGMITSGYGDEDRFAILGHSMGSGVAMRFGQQYPNTAAVVAVSPVSQSVTESLPKNLLLLAGSLEQSFVHNAEQILAQAGGQGGIPELGTARKMVIVPNVEHISIVFSPQAHHYARDWVDATFDSQPGAQNYTDRRMIWYLFGVVGFLILSICLSPKGIEASMKGEPKGWFYQFRSLLLGALMATILTWLISLAGFQMRNLFGILVGGYLFVWFGVAGLIAMLISSIKPKLPKRKAIIGGIIAFGGLWLGVGLIGQFVWLQWLLIPKRLILWPIGMLFLLPWFLAVGELQSFSGFWRRLINWFVQCFLIVGSLLLTLRLIPELGFLILILPVFPLVLALLEIAMGERPSKWAYALGSASFISWLLLAVFPLQS